MVVVGYGQIIPQVVIDLAPLGIINVHASLLPKYRGAAPIQWAIVNGETRTGVTTMRIDAGLDTGDMLLKAETEIGPGETAIELGNRLAAMGADLLVETLAGLTAGSIVPEKQDNDRGDSCAAAQKRRRPHRLVAARARDSQSGSRPATLARRLHHLPRPFAPYLAERTCQGREPCLPDGRAEGRILTLRPLTVSTGDGPLELLEVQLEGRKRIPAADFVNGQRVAENELLGETST